MSFYAAVMVHYCIAHNKVQPAPILTIRGHLVHGKICCCCVRVLTYGTKIINTSTKIRDEFAIFSSRHPFNRSGILIRNLFQFLSWKIRMCEMDLNNKHKDQVTVQMGESWCSNELCSNAKLWWLHVRLEVSLAGDWLRYNMLRF